MNQPTRAFFLDPIQTPHPVTGLQLVRDILSEFILRTNCKRTIE